MHYCKPLVLSDNIGMMRAFMELIEAQGIDLPFRFGISPFSDQTAYKALPFPVEVYNLKKEEETEQIVALHDIVFSIHSKQLFPAKLVRGAKCINVHPGYNPLNRGWYPQVFAILNKTQIGATIHEIDEQLDHGPIIAREFVEKYEWDTSNTLYQRILEKEVELLEKWLVPILENRYTTEVPEFEGKLYLKKDFNQLLKLDLDQPATLRECIDLLRALTHEPYQNAYFISKNGEKIFVSIKLSPNLDNEYR